MPHEAVPQPSLERMTPAAGHPIVAGVVPDQHPLVARTAAALVVGTRAPRPGARLREFVEGSVEGSVAAHLSHHQHRPVVTVPLDVGDWRELRGPWDR